MCVLFWSTSDVRRDPWPGTGPPARPSLGNRDLGWLAAHPDAPIQACHLSLHGSIGKHQGPEPGPSKFWRPMTSSRLSFQSPGRRGRYSTSFAPARLAKGPAQGAAPDVQSYAEEKTSYKLDALSLRHRRSHHGVEQFGAEFLGMWVWKVNFLVTLGGACETRANSSLTGEPTNLEPSCVVPGLVIIGQ